MATPPPPGQLPPWALASVALGLSASRLPHLLRSYGLWLPAGDGHSRPPPASSSYQLGLLRLPAAPRPAPSTSQRRCQPPRLSPLGCVPLLKSSIDWNFGFLNGEILEWDTSGAEVVTWDGREEVRSCGLRHRPTNPFLHPSAKRTQLLEVGWG